MPAPDDIATGLADGVYKEAHGTRRWGVDELGEWLVQGYFVPWEYRRTFARDLLAPTQIIGGPDGSWQISTPYRYPEEDENGNPIQLYAFTIQGQSEGTLTVPSNPIEYSDAFIQVTYRVPPFMASGAIDPFFINSFTQDPLENSALLWADQRLGSAYQEIPETENSYYWEGTVVKANTSVARRIQIQEMIITFHRVPYMPITKFRLFQDSLNDREFLGCETGTVFFGGATTERKSWVDGSVTQTVQMIFRWRTEDWNKYFRPSTKKWEFLNLTKNSGAVADRIYKYKDLRLLFLS